MQTGAYVKWQGIYITVHVKENRYYIWFDMVELQYL